MAKRIAHLSDLHVLARRRSRKTTHDLGTRFVSIGRSLDTEGRAGKVLRAIREARALGADHFVFSGDLTELGTEEQFEAFADCLDEAHLDPEHVTVVPGNHDTYASPDAWQRALEGPLARYRRGAADGHGKVVWRGNTAVVPLDVACHQKVTRSAGELTEEAAEGLARRLFDPAMRGCAIVVVMHHPPFPHGSRAWQWIDGLCGHERMAELLRRVPNAHVLHGHLHYVVDRERIFGATATVEDESGTSRVRIYDVVGERLMPGVRSDWPARKVA